MSQRLLFFLFLALPLASIGSVDTRIFDGSNREETEADGKQTGEVDPNARTGWNKEQKDPSESQPEDSEQSATDGSENPDSKGAGDGTGSSPLPVPPEPEKANANSGSGLPTPPEPDKSGNPQDPSSGQSSPGTRSSSQPPQLKGVSLDVAVPFPSDI